MTKDAAPLPAELTATNPSAAARAEAGSAPRPLTTVAREHYHIDGEHARGGIGRVLRAQDLRLGRAVAVKELLSSDPIAERRFHREARLTARLQHPAIVPVYEAGYWPDGRPFYSMRLVGGRALAELIAAAGALVDRLALLPHVIAVADAIAYAHSNRIVHRDLKPTNVLVGDFGETVVIDWGLAKDLTGRESEPFDGAGVAGEETVTVAGAVVGTPAFMAPEQAAGGEIDERTDVYALGALLRTVLTGGLPHRGQDASQLLRAVREHDLTPLDGAVPPDLASIVAKAMAADREARYGTAGELADDLRRYQAGRAVAAHRYSVAQRLGRWTARHRWQMRALALLLVALVIAALVALSRITAERDRTRLALDALTLEHARGAQREDPTATLAWLATYPADGRDWPAARELALRAFDARPAKLVFGAQTVAAMTVDGRRFARLVAGRIEARRTVDGALLASAAWPAGAAGRLQFVDPDTIAAIDDAGALRVWRLGRAGGGRLLSTATAAPLVLIPDSAVAGSAIAIGDRQAAHGLRTVSLVDGKVRLLTRFSDPIYCVLSSHDRQRLLATTSHDAELIERQSGAVLRRWPIAGQLACAQLSPDDRWVIVADAGGMHWFAVDDSSADVTVRSPELAGAPGPATIGADGSSVVTAGPDHALRLWDRRRRSARVIGQHDDVAVAGDFAADGQRLISLGRDGRLRIWRIADGIEEPSIAIGSRALEDSGFGFVDGHLFVVDGEARLRVWPMPPSPALVAPGYRGLGWSPDSRRVAATRYWQGSLTVFDLATRQPMAELAPAVPNAEGVAFSGDGKRVVVTSAGSGDAVIFDIDHGATTRLVDPAPAPAVTRLPSGDGFVRAHFDGRLSVYGFDGRLRARLDDAVSFIGRFGTVAIASGDGAIVAGNAAGLLRAWRSSDGALERTWLDGGRPITAVAIAGDGAVAAAERGGAVARYGGERERTLIRSGRDIVHLVYAPDGSLVTVDDQGTLHVLDRDGRLQATLRDAGDFMPPVFSADGRWLATARANDAVRLWSTADWSLQRVYGRDTLGQRPGVLAFSPDSQRLGWASENRGLQVVDLPPAPDVPADVEGLRRWIGRQTTAQAAPGVELESPWPR